MIDCSPRSSRQVPEISTMNALSVTASLALALLFAAPPALADGAERIRKIERDIDQARFEEAETELRAALAEEGNDARLLEIEGGGHVSNPGADAGRIYLQAAEDQPDAWLAMVDFLDETLGAP